MLIAAKFRNTFRAPEYFTHVIKIDFFCQAAVHRSAVHGALFPKPLDFLKFCNMICNTEVSMYDQITTARLPADTRNKLLALAKIKGRTKSDIIKEALEVYFEREENDKDSFTLGESSFGRYGSGENDRATTYKERIKRKLAGRNPPPRPTGTEVLHRKT